ncbi:Thiamine-phosphate synthase [Andreprevotia sp. IGB-42]|uniref:thiamine phosphate synthase n=1 Tax=Andreprevotia sp. IGB-42 TaxID=2497473 RepID=UPI00135AC06B|nr:thiamine phosphate synthase [Andreprevotia sp. IGB-42]KAF0812092.1 Thiamine-phosphate synthase [Andreprevotia sp. IGB-42]
MTRTPRIDRSALALYLVTDEAACLGRNLLDVVMQAVAGGVRCVQLREKHLPADAFIAKANALKALLAPLGVPLIINDRLDVALAVQADGLHIGQSDISVAEVRRAMPDAIVGLSVETPEQLLLANRLDVDYLGISPIFATPTKPDTGAPWGLAGLAAVREITRLPLVGIGAIHAGNAASVLAAGADAIAVVSAICSAPSPRAAAAELAALLPGNRTT